MTFYTTVDREITSTVDNTTTETIYIDKAYEKVTTTDMGMMNIVKEKYYINSPFGLVSIITKSAGTADVIEYVHRDHLGSTDVITDKNGQVITDRFGVEIGRFSFDPFGRRRQPDWLTGPPSQPIATTRGYTGHEHDDDLGLVNMNARIYEPLLGRFLTPDPIILDIYDPQSLNRYSYVKNNPLSATDPTGLFAEDISSDDEEVGCDDCDADFLVSDIKTTIDEMVSSSELDADETMTAIDDFFSEDELELAGGPIGAAASCAVNPLCWLGIGIIVGNAPNIPLKTQPIDLIDIRVDFSTESRPNNVSPIPSPIDSIDVPTPSTSTRPLTTEEILNGVRVNSEKSSDRAPARDFDMMKPGDISKDTVGSAPLSIDDAVDIMREGGNVIAKDKQTAQEIARDAGYGSPPVHDTGHGGGNSHYHTNDRNGGHVFY